MHSVHKFLIRWRGSRYIFKKSGAVQKSLLFAPAPAASPPPLAQVNRKPQRLHLLSADWMMSFVNIHFIFFRRSNCSCVFVKLHSFSRSSFTASSNFFVFASMSFVFLGVLSAHCAPACPGALSAADAAAPPALCHT